MNRKAFLLALLIVVVLAYTFANTRAFGRLDGWIMPVTDQLKITSDIRQEMRRGAIASVFDGEAFKHRSCDWLRTEWFLGDPNGRAAFVVSGYDGGPKLREKDKVLVWKGIWVRLAPEYIRENAYAKTYHNCYRGLTAPTETLHYVAVDR